MKPSRYIDHELNACHKNFDMAEVKVCLAFPDVYEVGISHLGLKILYTIINKLDYAMADRTYLPWLDALDIMREDKIPLYALESKRNVSEFDMVGITLQSELNFTNILELLDLSGIPLHSKDRTDKDPIVIAGGPCASNPLPLKPFIDAFLIGEGEDAIEEIIAVIRESKNSMDSCLRRNDVVDNSCAESHPEPVEGRRNGGMSSVVRQAHHDMNGTQDSCLRRNDGHGEYRNDNNKDSCLRRNDGHGEYRNDNNKDSCLRRNDNVVDSLGHLRAANLRNRNGILCKLASIKGMYVPLIHDEMIANDNSFRIKIRKYEGFAKHEKVHTPQLMPWQLATHNRYVAEIMRGCTRGCRFCHAGYFYRPVRERRPEDILEALLKEIEAYGWDEAGLSSLSSSDYTCIRPLLEAMLKKVNQDKTHVSLPSLRVDSFDDTLISLLKEVGREGLTIAPEAGSQRLRNIINKNLSEAEILHGVNIAKELGWQRIKLYFMIGLPLETEDDIQGIIDLINLILTQTGKRFQINVSLSPFVPKTHTPFQWVPMLKPDEILRRVLMIKHAFLRYKYIKIRYHTIESSLLEAILSRGSDDSAILIEHAWKLGAKYDGWNEGFDWKKWTQAIDETGFNLESVYTEIPSESVLPWDFVDLGVEKAWLQGEWKKAQEEVTSEDCRNGCIGCGVCDDKLGMQYTESSIDFAQSLSSIPMPEVLEHPGTKSTFIKSWHYRLMYEKGGDFRFVGHLDWMRMVFRLISRSKLPIVYTQGFNPHPKVSFSPALAIGITGENEYFDFHTSGDYVTDDLENALKPLFIEGLKLHSVYRLSDKEKDVQPVGDDLVIQFPSELSDDIAQKLKEFELSVSMPLTIHKKDGERLYDLKQVIIKIELQNGELHISKLMKSPNIYDLLETLLGISKDILHGWDIYRKRVFFPDE